MDNLLLIATLCGLISFAMVWLQTKE